MTQEQITGAKFIDLLNERLEKEVAQWKEDGLIPKDGSGDYPGKFGYLKGMVIAMASRGNTAEIAHALGLIGYQYSVVHKEMPEAEIHGPFNSEYQAELCITKLRSIHTASYCDQLVITSKIVER